MKKKSKSLLLDKFCIVIKKVKNIFYLLFTGRVVEYSLLDELDKKVEVINSKNKRGKIPKVIWIYWHDDVLPELVNSCVNNIAHLNPDYDVRLLNSKTVINYIPEVESWSYSNSIQIKSDLIRLNLLLKYGGVWIDASVLLFEDLDWITKLSELERYDLVGFYRSRLTKNYSSPIVESWLIAAPVNNKFIKKWCDVFNPIANLGLDCFYTDISGRLDFSDIRQNINIPKYLSVYLAHQIAVKEYGVANFYLRHVELSGYFYQESYPQRDSILSKVWCESKSPKCTPPLIKFTSQNRRAITNCKDINPESIIGRYLNR